MGIEPTNGGTTNHCLNHLATLAVFSHYSIIDFNLIALPKIFLKIFYSYILIIYS